MSEDARATVTLTNETGLHARPASELVKTASNYDAAITINGTDAKSLLGIMAMGASNGSELEIAATGPDAQAAVDGIVALISSNFGE